MKHPAYSEEKIIRLQGVVVTSVNDCNALLVQLESIQGLITMAYFKNATAPPMNRGEAWQITGCYEKDADYGTVLVVQNADRTLPKDALAIPFLLFNNFNVSRFQAMCIWEEFGTSIFACFLSGKFSSSPLISKLHISIDCALAIEKKWKSDIELIEVLEHLRNVHLDETFAKQLVALYGPETLSKLKENPYRLSIFYNLISIDEYQKRIGKYNAYDLRRLKAIIALVVSRFGQRPRTLIPIQEFISECIYYSDTDDGKWRLSLEQLLCSSLVVVDSKFIIDQRNFEAEYQIASKLRSLLKTDHSKVGSELFITNSPTETELSNLAEFISNSGVSITECADDSFLDHIASALQIYSSNITLCFQIFCDEWHLSNALEITSKVFLRCTLSDFIRHKHSHQIPEKSVLVLANSSWLDARLLASILSHLPKSTSVVILNDIPCQGDQKCGGLTAELVTLHSIGKIKIISPPELIDHKLSSCIRSVFSSRIPFLAPYTAKSCDLGCFYVSASASELEQYAIGLYFQNSKRGSAVIYAVDPAICESINKRLHATHTETAAPCPKNKKTGLQSGLPDEGEPAYFSAFPKRPSLTNVVGTLKCSVALDDYIDDVNEASSELFFRVRDSYFSVTAEQAAHSQFAYALCSGALTRNKFDVVIIALSNSTKENRSWILTCMARSKGRVIFVGDTSQLGKSSERIAESSVTSIPYILYGRGEIKIPTANNGN